MKRKSSLNSVQLSFKKITAYVTGRHMLVCGKAAHNFSMAAIVLAAYLWVSQRVIVTTILSISMVSEADFAWIAADISIKDQGGM